MLRKLDAKFLRSLHVIVRTPAWNDVRAALQEELLEIQTKLIHQSDITLIHELRGRAKDVSEFLAICADTQTLLEKLDKR